MSKLIGVNQTVIYFIPESEQNRGESDVATFSDSFWIGMEQI
jgi:hypothetical protein